MTMPIPGVPLALTTAVSTTQVIIDWITGMGWPVEGEFGWPLFAGPEILDMPDRAVFITGTSGPGFVTEEAGLDARSFQARLRGPSGDLFTAETMAQALDRLLIRAALPVTVDGVTISAITREGGSPAPLPLDPNDRRFEFTANYIATIGVI